MMWGLVRLRCAGAADLIAHHDSWHSSESDRRRDSAVVGRGENYLTVAVGTRDRPPSVTGRVLSEVIEDGLKPLTTSQTPSENSKSCDRKCGQPCQGAMLPDETEQHGEVASDEKGRSNESDPERLGHQARLVQHEAEQQVATAGMKLCPRRKMRSYRATSAWLVTNALLQLRPFARSRSTGGTRRRGRWCRIPEFGRRRGPTRDFRSAS